MFSYFQNLGKYQSALDFIQKLIPESGESKYPRIEFMRVVVNAYYDYYNNGGCNRRLRLVPMLDLLTGKFPRGGKGSKALSRLRRYKPSKDASEFAGFGCIPDGLESLYEDIINEVIELYFHEMIPEPRLQS